MKYLLLRTLLILSHVALFFTATECRGDDKIIGSLSPQVRQLLKQNPTLFSGVTNELVGRALNRDLQLYYFYSEDERIARAFHSYSGDGVIILIRENQEPIDQWICFAFELFNSRSKGRFAALYEKAKSGTISKSDFGNEIVRIEFDAVKTMKTTIARWTLSTNLVSQSYYHGRFLSTPESFEQFKTNEFTRASGIPTVYRHYEMEYDALRPK